MILIIVMAVIQVGEHLSPTLYSEVFDTDFGETRYQSYSPEPYLGKLPNWVYIFLNTDSILSWCFFLRSH